MKSTSQSWLPIELADKGKYVTRMNPKGVEYQMFDHNRIIASNKTWVGETYWHPPGTREGGESGRWDRFGKEAPPTDFVYLPEPSE